MSKLTHTSRSLLLLITLWGSAPGCLPTERVCVVEELCGTEVSAQQAYETCQHALNEGTNDANLLEACKRRAESCTRGDAPPEWCGVVMDAATTDATRPEVDAAMTEDASVRRDGGGPCPPCGPKEHCDEQLGRCVQCLQSSHCEGALLCDEASGQCVQCLEDADCGADAPVCSANRCTGCATNAECARFVTISVCAGDGRCAQCASDADCADPSAAKCSATNTCVPCDNSAQCAHQPGLGVCVTGTCKECDGAHYDFCGFDTGNTDKPFVCDSLNHTCSDHVEGSSGLCGPCVSDAHCPAGQMCVLQRFDDTDIGYFCMWRRAAGVGGAPESCTTAQPYFKTLTAVSSVDGTVGDVCSLAVSTCPAHRDYRSPNVACAPAGVPNDALCGATNVEDGYCRSLAPPDEDTYWCTVPCVSDVDCSPSSTCNTLVMPRVCSL